MTVDIIFLAFLLCQFSMISPSFYYILWKGCVTPMNLFTSLSIVLIFVLWLNYEIRKNSRLSKKNMEEFWKKEAKANQTRKADISNLDYIKVPIDKLPLADTPDQTINSYRDTILSLSGKKVLNLTGFSNTELKLKYGASNINLLSEYDNNYTMLVAILQKWGERLYSQGYKREALSVLETAVECKTDVPKTYELLADIYIEQGSPNKINLLMDALSKTHVRNKESLLLNLENKKF